MRFRPASLEPLRERPFRLLFLGRTLSGVGDAIVPVALTFAVLKHGSATDLGIVLGCEWGGRLLFLLGIGASFFNPASTGLVKTIVARAGPLGLDRHCCARSRAGRCGSPTRSRS